MVLYFCPPVSRSCDNTSMDINVNTTFHPINYAFLAQLFEDTDLIENLDPQKLYQRAPEISVPKLSSASN